MALLPEWPQALDAATLADPAARVPFVLAGREVGSVARAALDALRDAAGAEALVIAADRVGCDAACGPELDAVLDRLHRRLRAGGWIRAWRDETVALVDPVSLAPLARIERAAARFWGTLTFGAHANGYVAGADGRPAALWIARRAATKAIDPGRLDNLVGGGVPAGQSPEETLVREAGEEAGLEPIEVAGARPAGVLRLARDIPEGFQHEWLHGFDLELPAGREPRNRDGEVAGFERVAVAEAAALAAGGEMTVDAALVTLDFLWRHRIIDDRDIGVRIGALRVVRRR